jgi:hypothetical protein
MADADGEFTGRVMIGPGLGAFPGSQLSLPIFAHLHFSASPWIMLGMQGSLIDNPSRFLLKNG